MFIIIPLLPLLCLRNSTRKWGCRRSISTIPHQIPKTFSACFNVSVWIVLLSSHAHGTDGDTLEDPPIRTISFPAFLFFSLLSVVRGQHRGAFSADLSCFFPPQLLSRTDKKGESFLVLCCGSRSWIGTASIEE